MEGWFVVFCAPYSVFYLDNILYKDVEKEISTQVLNDDYKLLT